MKFYFSPSTHILNSALEYNMRPHEDPYEAIQSALGVVGKLGTYSVPKRMGQAQAMLYRIRDDHQELSELRAVSKLIRGCAIALMHTAADLDKAGGKKSRRHG